ncbi:TPA: hypothetical protein ACSP0C_003073 [Aeromonas veronii]
MLYLLLAASTAISSWSLDALPTVDTQQQAPSLIQQGPAVPSVREHVADSLSQDMLTRERKHEHKAPIQFREEMPHDPVGRDIEHHYSKFR